MEKLLSDIVQLQDFAAKRGLELVRARGSDLTFYDYPDFDFDEDGIGMLFSEKASHDCPSDCGVRLAVGDLKLSDEEWLSKIEIVKADTASKKLEAEQKERERVLESKRKQFEKLKAELGQ